MTEEKVKNWQDQLCSAAAQRNLAEVKRCIENGADVNKSDLDKFGPPLIYAVVGGDVEIVKHILDSGADVNQSTRWSETPLFIACREGHVDVVKFLIENGAEMDTCDKWRKDTPLTVAASHGHAEVVNYLLTRKVNVDKPGDRGKTALGWAAYNGHLNVVKVLLEFNAQINCVDEDNKTPLIYALDEQNLDIAKYLVEKGCDVPAFDKTLQSNILSSLTQALEVIDVLIGRGTNDETLDERCLKNILESDNWSMIKYLVEKCGEKFKVAALSKAASTGRPDLLDYVVSKGGDVNKIDYNGNTPLISAVKSEMIDSIDQLTAHNVDVCKMGRNGKTPLLVAVEMGNLQLVNYLLDYGATPTVQTAFLEAIQRENFLIVQCLKEKGALINFTYKNGQTPLTKAIQTRNVKIARYLVDNGADATSVVDDPNNSFLMECVTEKNLEMVMFLKSLGAKLDVAGETGYTPLTKAAELEHFPMVKYFVEEGADVNRVDGKGRVPLAAAADAKSFSISKFLIESGAKIELAREEVENYCQCSEDFAIFLSLSRKESVAGTENEECSKDVDKDD